MKKFVSLLLALMLIMALGSVAFADGETTGSITVKNVTIGKTYDLYRILDMTTYDETDKDSAGNYANVSYTFAAKWRGFFLNEDATSVAIAETAKDYLITADDYAKLTANQADYTQIVDGDNTYYLHITSSNASAFAQDALDFCAKDIEEDYSKTATLTPAADQNVTEVTGTETTYDLEFSSLALGYYLVFPQGATDIGSSYGSICSLDSTMPDVDVVIKAEYPDITKSGSTTVDAGTAVTFTIEGKVPDTTGYTSYDYIIYDDMEDNISDVELAKTTLKVMIGDKDITTACTVKTEATELTGVTDQAGESFTPDFAVIIPVINYQESNIGDTITVTYDTTAGGAGKNYAFLAYSNDPEDPDDEHGKTLTKEAEVTMSSVTVDKYDGSDETQETKLAGAKFVLYKEDTNGKAYYFNQDGKVTWNPLKDGDTFEKATSGTDAYITAETTSDKGVATFYGIADNTKCKLQEIEAPKGYNRATTDTECEAGDTVDVANFSGTELPSTGGIGTTIFYIVGGLLVVGAAVLIVTKKRAGAAEE